MITPVNIPPYLTMYSTCTVKLEKPGTCRSEESIGDSTKFLKRGVALLAKRGHPSRERKVPGTYLVSEYGLISKYHEVLIEKRPAQAHRCNVIVYALVVNSGYGGDGAWSRAGGLSIPLRSHNITFPVGLFVCTALRLPFN
jgi:hypothetical protein